MVEISQWMFIKSDSVTVLIKFYATYPTVCGISFELFGHCLVGTETVLHLDHSGNV